MDKQEIILQTYTYTYFKWFSKGIDFKGNLRANFYLTFRSRNHNCIGERYGLQR